MDTLSTIFGSEARVKILRLFLFGPDTPFLLSEVASRTQSLARIVRRELAALEKADLIRKKRSITKEDINSGRKPSPRKVKGVGYYLNKSFPHIGPLKDLLSATSLVADDALAKRFTHAGKIKLVIASGVFIRNWDSRVDLLIVGDELNQHKIETAIRAIEAEIGKEVAYSAFETADFEYRQGIHDRLVRDILDYPHATLVDRLGIEPQ